MSGADKVRGAGSRLREVVVEVRDVVSAARFYEGVGLELVGHGRWERGDYAELSDPEGLKLMLIEGEGGIRLAFTVEDVPASLAGVVSDGGSVQVPPTPAGGGVWATALDPWGTPLGFWSPGASNER